MMAVCETVRERYQTEQNRMPNDIVKTLKVTHNFSIYIISMEYYDNYVKRTFN